MEQRHWEWHEIADYVDKLDRVELEKLKPSLFGDLSYGQIVLLRNYINFRLLKLRRTNEF